jgi:hypothetical protein
MKSFARFCGIVSVLFLVACIIACGSQEERAKTPDKSKTKTESIPARARIRLKTDDAKTPAKPQIKSKTKS